MDTAERETFGELLRRYRAAASLTQEEVAARTGLTPQGIGLLERGERQHPHKYTVQKLADALALSVQERACLEATARRSPALSGLHPTPDFPLGPSDTGAAPPPVSGHPHERATHVLRRWQNQLLVLLRGGHVGKVRLSRRLVAGLSLLLTVSVGVVVGLTLSSTRTTSGAHQRLAAAHALPIAPHIMHMGLHLGRAIFPAVDVRGTVYVSDFDNYVVVKLSPTGKLRATWGQGGLHPVGEAVDRQGHLYVTGDAAIWAFSPAGQPLATWSVPNPEAKLEGIALDRQGNVYVTDLVTGRVSKLSPQGKLIVQWDVATPRPVTEPVGGGIAADSQDHLYVVDRLRNRIVKLSTHGRVLAVWEQRGKFGSPSSVAVDPQGLVFVGDSGNHRIVKLSPYGRVLVRWGRDGTGPGCFRGNLFVAVGPQGTVYVADDTTNTIQTFSPTGQLRAVWVS